MDDGAYQNMFNHVNGQVIKSLNGNVTPVKKEVRNVSPEKRHLPVASKKMIYNEWGAIIKHQDEIGEALI